MNPSGKAFLISLITGLLLVLIATSSLWLVPFVQACTR